MVSVAAMLETDWRVPSIGYEDLLKTTRAVTRHEPDVEMIFRRMTFNVFAHNRDDHTKQHAFLMDSAGRWRIAPSYDLTFSAGPGGEHYLTVAGQGKDIPRSALEAVATSQSIRQNRSREAIDLVTDAVSRFGEFAKRYDVSRRTTEEVTKALDRQLTLGRPAFRTKS